MKKRILLSSIFFLAVSIGFYLIYSSEYVTGQATVKFKKQAPGDWFFQQRAYPLNDIPYEKYFAAIEEKKVMEQMDNPTSNVAWVPNGPYNIGGRITAIAVNPSNPNIIIIGAAAGGIFKSTNGGLNWSPKTDSWPSLSVGALVMHLRRRHFSKIAGVLGPHRKARQPKNEKHRQG